MENGCLHSIKHVYKTTMRRILLKIKFSEGIFSQNHESIVIFKYSFIENCIVYDLMLKNVVDRDTEQDYIIQHMRFACCLIRLMYKQDKYNLLLFHVNKTNVLVVIERNV
jgi:hypothetical protein